MRRGTDGHRWLDTAIGDLPAAVIPCMRGGTLAYDIVVFSRADPSFDPDRGGWFSAWTVEGTERFFPRLGHGYVFVGARAGALRAMTFDPPSLESVVGGLWDLAAWARTPLRLEPSDDVEAPVRRERRRAWVVRVVDVAIITLAVVILRRAG